MYSSKFTVVTSEKSRSPASYFFTNSSYVPIGDDPVASPNMQSGFNVTTDAMMFAAFLLISSYDFVLIILMIFLLLMRAQCHRAWFLFSFYRVLNSKNI